MTDDHMVPAAEAAGTRSKSEPQLDHVALVVASLDRSAAFYSQLLGLDILHQVRLADHTLQYLSSGSSVLLELIEYDEPRGAVGDDAGVRDVGVLDVGVRDVGIQEARDAGVQQARGDHHLAWNVADAAAVEAKVEALGGRVVATGRYVPELDFISLMAQDPDGFLVEIVQREGAA
ncbi:MAG: VOC family protein [Ancrocorticia sp.]